MSELLEEYNKDNKADQDHGLVARVMARPVGEAALKIRIRTKALKDILTRSEMMLELSERQECFLLAVFSDYPYPINAAAVDKITDACQEILNQGVY